MNVQTETIFSPADYGNLPRSSATYLMKIRHFWYVGFTLNLYNRAKYRKSRLRAGLCNEPLVQEAFTRFGVLPKYMILSRTDRESYYFREVLAELGKERSMNALLGGHDVSSHKKDSRPVYEKISQALKNKYANSPEYRSVVFRAAEIAAARRMKPAWYKGKLYRSLNDLSARTGLPRGSLSPLIRKGEIILDGQIDRRRKRP